MHEINYIHLNICPEHILIGLNEKSNSLHLVGLGFVQPIFLYKGIIKLSRREELESLLFMLL